MQSKKMNDVLDTTAEEVVAEKKMDAEEPKLMTVSEALIKIMEGAFADLKKEAETTDKALQDSTNVKLMNAGGQSIMAQLYNQFKEYGLIEKKDENTEVPDKKPEA